MGNRKSDTPYITIKRRYLSMGISFYYAVQILWRAQLSRSFIDNPSKPPLDRGGLGGRSFGCNLYNKKARRSLFGLSAVWTRLELATPCVTGRYSNQLNYHTVLLFASANVIQISQSANHRAIFLRFSGKSIAILAPNRYICERNKSYHNEKLYRYLET